MYNGIMIDRQNKEEINQDILEKIVLITGPRQTGKTTLSKSLVSNYEYINYDEISHRKILMDKSWNRDVEAIIFDEIHKMTEWKRYLKGIYDTEGVRPKLIVTGSARLDVFRKVGDSLAGRFFKHRLYPFDIKELLFGNPDANPSDLLDQLIKTSGYPEPFLKGTEAYYKRWRKNHLDIILRQDVLDLVAIKQLNELGTLIELLRYRVGSPISYASLARDIQVSPQTIKQWLMILESLYVVFKVQPYTQRVTRSILKEPKYYFYDTAYVEGDMGVKLENHVALSLLKEAHRVEDLYGDTISVHYCRSRNGQEIDFCIVKNKIVTHLIEVKLSDNQLSKQFNYFGSLFQDAKQIQWVKNCSRTQTFPNGAMICNAANGLSKLSFE